MSPIPDRTEMPLSLLAPCPECGFTLTGTTKNCHSCSGRQGLAVHLIGWLAVGLAYHLDPRALTDAARTILKYRSEAASGLDGAKESD